MLLRIDASRGLLLTVLALVLSVSGGRASEPLAPWRARLTFHAAFDGSADATFAAGDPKIYTANDLSRKQSQPGLATDAVGLSDQGRWGGSLRFHDTTPSVVFFQGKDNVPYGPERTDLTISFWMRLSPDEDLKPGYVDPLQITDKQWNNASLFVDFTKDERPRHFRLGVFSDYNFWNPTDTPWDDIPAAKRPMVTVTRPPFSNQAWTHVAVTLEDINSGHDAIASLYLNGESQGQLKGAQRFTWDPQAVAIMLGIQYIGAIDDFAIFRGAMTPAEILQLTQLEGGISALGQTTDAKPAADAEGWIALFDGKSLDGWQVKIRGYDLGDNFGQTFRVEDGRLKVAYDQYDGEFNERFGHLFYRQPFSDYDLRVEYRFVGTQARGGPGWAVRNSGVMLHGQDPATMAKDQRFPVSIEVQLLGGTGTGTRTTANLCTPGTHVVMDGQLVTRHCTSSKSKTYHGDQWVTVLMRVRGHELIEHVIDGETVLAYSKPQLDPGDEDAKRLLATQDVKLSGGTISLQSESHPVEFRKVEIRPLK